MKNIKYISHFRKSDSSLCITQECVVVRGVDLVVYLWIDCSATCDVTQMLQPPKIINNLNCD